MPSQIPVRVGREKIWWKPAGVSNAFPTAKLWLLFGILLTVLMIKTYTVIKLIKYHAAENMSSSWCYSWTSQFDDFYKMNTCLDIFVPNRSCDLMRRDPGGKQEKEQLGAKASALCIFNFNSKLTSEYKQASGVDKCLQNLLKAVHVPQRERY